MKKRNYNKIDKILELPKEVCSNVPKIIITGVDEMIVEIATIYYNYDKIYEEYGIDKTRAYNPEDKDYPSYEKYIQYITKYEHTKRLIRYRQMIASMYAK